MIGGVVQILFSIKLLNKHSMAENKCYQVIHDKVWFKDPMILVKHDRLLEFFITDDQVLSEKLNAFMRFGVYISLALSVYNKNPRYFIILAIIALITVVIFNFKKDTESGVKDTFTESLKKVKLPTEANPVGNPLAAEPDEYRFMKVADTTSYTDEALKNKKIKEDMILKGVVLDPNDTGGKSRVLRNFYTLPSQGRAYPDADGSFRKRTTSFGNSAKEDQFVYSQRLYTDLRQRG